MIRPILDNIPTSRKAVEVFKGYNANLRSGEGEFAQMQNLTGAYYPVLSPRARRKLIVSTDTDGMIWKDALYHVAGGTLYVNGLAVEGLSLTEGEKSMVSMGAYLLIFPDKKWINTKNLTDYGNIEASYTSTTTVDYSLCASDGGGLNVTTISSSEPSNPANMDYWLDTGGEVAVLKQYSESSGVWTTVPTTFVKIAATGIGAAFQKGDGVTVSGVTPEELSGLNATILLQEVYHASDGVGDYIVVTGIASSVYSQDTPVSVSRAMPLMDYIIESNNRLWGCRYGLNAAGETVNELYASALGDFKNWNKFEGISTDSYAASLGSDGQFTGAITYQGYPLFFKESVMCKVYGNAPSNYQVMSSPVRGVQKGSGNSLAICNEILYYKAREGVMAYDGSSPVSVSAALGTHSYKDASGGAVGDLYYIHMAEGAEHTTFVYDSAKDMWHREDDVPIVQFLNAGELLYARYADGSSTKIMEMTGKAAGTAESSVEWYAVSGTLNVAKPDREYISRLSVKAKLESGSTLEILANYDDEETEDGPVWRRLQQMSADKLQTTTMMVRPRRADHLRIKLHGTGECKIYSVTRTTEEGSDER